MALVTGGSSGIGRAIAEALGRSRAEASCPPPLTAELFADPAWVAAAAARTMVGRNGELAHFAGAAVFLASDSSAYVTGQTLFVDGGVSVA